MREGLADDYRQVQAMLDKLEHGHVHIAAFGRVSVGKSATLNALLGYPCFATSPLHGETRYSQSAAWDEYEAGGVYLIDTPGIDEVDGESRERVAHDVAARSDIILFVVDGDINDTELRALQGVAAEQRPTIVVLNKADRYTRQDLDLLLATLRERTAGLVAPENVVSAAAEPMERVYVRVDQLGNETETAHTPPSDVTALKERLWRILEGEGKTLAALNAAMFAGDLSDQIAARIIEVKSELAEQVIRTYCVSKGVAVALNPIPVSDLLAAAVMDVSLVVHLSRVYDLPLTRSEAGSLVRTILAQLGLIMGTVWLVHLASSALKAGTAGLSAVATGAAQGAVAYYSTYVVGRAAQRYLARGKSWGDEGPKQAVREILGSLDRDSIIAHARADIMARLRSA